MNSPRQKIYLEVVVLSPDNAVELNPRELLAIPCNYLKCQEAEKRMLIIEYSPGSEQTTRDEVVRIHLRAYSRRYTILSYQVFDGFVPELPQH